MQYYLKGGNFKNNLKNPYKGNIGPYYLSSLSFVRLSTLSVAPFCSMDTRAFRAGG
uniref:Uncharacterized protein n=1 Tax=Anguilla anguilla TaxID=7936 RepID=A0A0E9SHA3_ANGAN